MSRLVGRWWERFGRVLAGALLLVGLGLLAGACGLESDASSAVTAPLLALKDSDTVVEENLQTVLTTVQAGEPSSAGAISTTSGPSESYSVISVSSAPGEPSVLAGYNQLSHDCLGIVDMTTPSTSVLGETQPGTYYFWIPDTAASGCDAASFAATPATPSGWPTGDPSGTGWPLP